MVQRNCYNGPHPTGDIIMLRHFDRRAFLSTAAALPIALRFANFAAAQPGAQPGAFPGMITRQLEPSNLEFPFATLDTFLVPTERFYVRNHFAAPRLDAATWTLDISGAVDRPLRLSYEELRNMESRTTTVTLECAGNNRVDLTPRERGVLWSSGAVGNAEWTGTPLSAVLQRAGVRASAVEIVLEGADEGTVNDEPRSPGAIHFARSVPVSKRDVLLAYRMNGRDLTPAHGYPVRAIVPGWYGMASIKWLTKIVAVERPFQGFFQTLDYAYFTREGGNPAIRPITEMEVKASIARPAPHEMIPAAAAYRIHGAAWAGEADITQVEVSVDGGTTWSPARLLGERVPHAWRLWEMTWANPLAGRHTLMARATDSRGRTQPMRRDTDRRNYMISHVLPVPVEVR